MLRPLLLSVTLFVLAPAQAFSEQLAVSPKERDALVNLDRGKYRDARRLAEESLAEQKTFIAEFVLGVTLAEFEGNLARGLFYIRSAKRRLLGEYGASPKALHPQRWHKRILMREQAVLGMMDNRSEQLDVLTEYDAEYFPKQQARRIWPLLKLGRFDEARTIGKALIHDEKPEVRERAYNGLMAVEEESGNRESSYKWGQLGLVETRGESCVIATNLALGARRTFRFEQTIEHDQTALKARDNSCPTSPHAQLAAMYLVMGEFQKSLGALKALRRVSRTGDLRVQNEMVIRARFVELLYAIGGFEEATVRAQQIIEQPDRAGMVSASSETIELTNNLLAWIVFDAHREQLGEKISARSFLSSFDLRWERARLAVRQWRAGREVRRLGAIDNLVVKSVRPYYTDLMPWYAAGIAQVFGDGVITKAMTETRALEKDFKQKIALFLDAYSSEQVWRNGQLETAISDAQRILRELPPEPRLLRHRIRAWLADALTRSGQPTEGAEQFHRVLDFYPTALRHLKIRLPVVVEQRGPRSADIADRIANSPRLYPSENAAFAVTIDDMGDKIVVCLKGRKTYGCGRVTVSKLKEDQTPITAAIDAFHDAVFSPRIELTQSDISSLDGRAVRGHAKGIIDTIKGIDGVPKRKVKP